MIDERQKPFSIVSTKEAFSCPYYHIQHDRYILPNGEEGDYYIVSTNGSVMVIPELTDGRFVMVRQFRYITQELMLEFPCGGLHKEEEPEIGAQREGEEEVGLIGGKIQKIGEFVPFNGIADEVCSLYHVYGAQLGKNHPDDDEELEVVLLTAKEIIEYIRTDGIRDGMTLAAWQLFQAKK